MLRALFLALSLISCSLSAQTLTQTVRGRVTSDTEEALVGAQVFISNVEPKLGTYTDSLGNFVLEKVPVGRRSLEVRLVGYGPFLKDNIALNSAKEYYINVTLSTGIEMEAVVLSAFSRSEPVNEVSVLSARRLDPEELQYHAATANDPSRLVQGMPGVQNGRDNRNEVVIRGNSPVGVLWRLEGIDIPNPNHYAGAGSSGGGITVFSAGMLGTSDFSTGAFPAEYGNAMSGVFDMRFRNGNKQQREHTFRAGLLGLDLATEGPIVKGKSSYLANFRYSTLGALNQLGIYLVGPRIDNNFIDFSFKVHHQGKKSQLSLWGLGGLSSQIQRPLEGEEWQTYRDYYIYDYGTRMGVAGGSWKQVLDDKSFIEVNVGVMGQNAFTIDDTLASPAAIDTGRVKTEQYITQRNTLHVFYKRKFSNRFSLKVGSIGSSIRYNFLDEKWIEEAAELQTIIDAQGNTWQAQPYVQTSFKPTSKLTLNAGLHAMYFGLNGSSQLEPRFGARWVFSPNTSLALGYGLHSRHVPMGNYFILVDGETPNLELDLMKSHHFIAALDQVLFDQFRVHLEAYYQRLYDLPVRNDPDRKIFVLNRLWGFDPDPLTSTGTGTNYGIDFSVEKFFKKGAFFVLSGSALKAVFQLPDDDAEYASNYDTRFSANFTGGQMFQLGENTFLETGIRFIFNTGYPVTPLLDSELTNDGYEPPFDFSRPNADRLPNYFRPDLRIALRRNRPKFAWWLALDIQNFINRQNTFSWYQWDRDAGQWGAFGQSPLTPVLTFWLDF